ncbi:uncharacterized protein LOC143040612 [Oratosquilla oratoria]|uniref:uncharacterized protein LOC143040612 n=1 Tax=Oratosquilla oratoria TaxID=337810 RepID=UPI003F7578F1
MKRVKESGAAFRKKRKAREELIKTHKGALLKYIKPTETTINIDQTVQTTTKTGDVCESKPISDSNNSSPSDSPNTSDVEHETHEAENILDVPDMDRVDLKDVGLWPSKIDSNTRILLVRQGASKIQNIDSTFGEVTEVIRQGASTKGQTRHLTHVVF